MTLWIDADGCPVVDRALSAAKKRNIRVVLVCDSAHVFEREGAETVTVSTGPDSADFALVNRIGPGDVAVTQDYGLAAMCLARGAAVLNQDGLRYTAENMDALLLSRYTAQKIRRAGGRLKGPKKRAEEQNRAFDRALAVLLDGGETEPSNCHFV